MRRQKTEDRIIEGLKMGIQIIEDSILNTDDRMNGILFRAGKPRPFSLSRRPPWDNIIRIRGRE
jgi:hypothetical protein